MDTFPIYEISSFEAAEVIGARKKFWYTENGDSFLFKIGRENTGENWAEVVSSQLARMIDLPHASYDFAKQENVLGVRTKSITAGGELRHGNEILSELDDYPLTQNQKFCKIPEYTLDVVLRTNDQPSLLAPPGYSLCTSGKDVFIGYLIFDAWIGNVDRHHQNWAWILLDGLEYLSPSFDHASSLGRELTNKERQNRLSSHDQRFSVEYYAMRAATPFYRTKEQKRTLKIFEIAEILKMRDPQKTDFWIGRILSIRMSDIETILDRIPGEVISSIEKEFILQFLKCTSTKLLNIYRNS